ncbi:uncharacterized protein LOC119793261 [Cyprinodon tularosa]|uniref:uncharacterized protein LOC119793261 n=1 Tax=Cyprinodon tularosa TaxID=77115 RepID=UPI0018E21379|nr:uncharacterized protein LOC119793261 [Cyprinodon tularosa]
MVQHTLLQGAKVPKPTTTPPPSKALPKPAATLTEKRCLSDGGDKNAAPWRRTGCRAKNMVAANQLGKPTQERNSKPMDEEVESAEVKTIQEVSSLASTPFSISHLMTPIIPSGEPTETLQTVLSPSVCDLLGSTNSEAKVTPEPQVKRETYKSLASSILFKLKDNRKRVKSQYSPKKFKTLELIEGGYQTLPSDNTNHPLSEGSGSGLSTPAILKDGLTVSPVLEHIVSPSHVSITTHNSDKPVSEDYLVENVLQGKCEAGNIYHGEDSRILPLNIPKNCQSPLPRKLNYSSPTMYEKTNHVNSDLNNPSGPQSNNALADTNILNNGRKRELCSNALSTNTRLSSIPLKVDTDYMPVISPQTLKIGQLSSGGDTETNAKTLWVLKHNKEVAVQLAPKEDKTGDQTICRTNVIKDAKEAISMAGNIAQSANLLDSNSNHIPDASILRQKEIDQRAFKLASESRVDSLVTGNNYALLKNEPCHVIPVGKCNVHKEPPPVPKRHFSKSDALLCLSVGKQQMHADKVSKDDLLIAKLDLQTEECESAQEQGKHKQVFSSRLNDFIKHEKQSLTSNERANYKETYLKMKAKMETDEEMESIARLRNSEYISNDFQALKELERAHLNDCKLENMRSRLEIFRIEKDAKAKNNLISRKLRNIKKGMLSVRGNGSTKKNIFVAKEHGKQDVFVNQNRNLIAIKAILNYDCEELEEVRAERENRCKFTEQGEITTAGDNFIEKSGETWSQEGRKDHKNCMFKPTEKKNDSTFPHKEKNLKQRFGDLKKNTTLPGPPEKDRLGNKEAVPDIDTEGNKQSLILNIKGEGMIKNLDNYHRETKLPETAGYVCNNREKYLTNERDEEWIDAPLVAPRTKKVGRREKGNPNFGSSEEQLSRISTGPEINVSGDVNKALLSQHETFDKEWQDEVKYTSLKQSSETDMFTFGLGNKLMINTSLKIEATSEGHAKPQEMYESERKASLKPDSITEQNDNINKKKKTQHEHFKLTNEDIYTDAEELGKIPRNIVSPFLLKKDVRVVKSQHDQASMSPKSCYFTMESTLNTTAENGLDFYFLGNSPTEVKQVNEPGQTVSPNNLRETGVECCFLSGQEYKLSSLKQPLKSTKSQQELPFMDSPARSNGLDFDKQLHQTNKKQQPSMSNGLDFDKQLQQENENRVPSVSNDLSTNNISITTVDVFKVKEISAGESPTYLLASSNIQNEGCSFIPQQEERFCMVNPSSEGRKGLQASTAEPTDDSAENSKVFMERKKTKDVIEPVFISRSNNGQNGLPKPPKVLPKSEKAVQKAIKLTNRRMKKDESQRLTQKLSQSSGKHRAEDMRNNKSEQKNSGSAKTCSNNKKKNYDNNHTAKHHSNDSHVQDECHSANHNQNEVETNHKSWRQRQDSKEGNYQRASEPTNLTSERQIHTTDSYAKEKPDCKDYNTDSIISNVPVYKVHVSERPMSKRPFNRSQSIDRYLGSQEEHRFSTNLPISERLEPRTLHIENSIKHDIQQRGRAKEKPNKGLPLRRSQSTDAYNTNRTPLYRQSNHTGQFSCQSSMDHAVLTQSLPITQRKLLQDPDSGQYFFVDLPVQVKTKTFLDPATGGYIQLPVQQPDGGVPQAPKLEVLTSPLVVYHSFVPVPLSPMAQKANIQASHVEPRGLQHRQQEMARHIKEGRPYLEPAYRQQDLMLAEFLDTEELN